MGISNLRSVTVGLVLRIQNKRSVRTAVFPAFCIFSHLAKYFHLASRGLFKKPVFVKQLKMCLFLIRTYKGKMSTAMLVSHKN